MAKLVWLPQVGACTTRTKPTEWNLPHISGVVDPPHQEIHLEDGLLVEVFGLMA